MRNEKGSLTVEAAISLPVFLLVILSISFLIKIVYVHEVIQHAIYEVANEISTYGYILSASGVNELDDILKEEAEERANLFNDHLDDFAKAYVSMNDLNNDTDFDNMEEKYKDFEEKINIALTSGKELYEEPIDEAYSLMFSLGGLAYNDAKSFVLQNIAKLSVRKYISPNDISKVNDKLKALNIEGGLKNLDFTQSQFFKDGDDIDIIVRYKLNLVLPIDILPDLYIIQRATVRGWLDGNDR